MVKINITIPFNLYVLRLLEGKYYIGITHKTILERVSQHKKGKGAIWTKIYKPIDIVESLKTNNIFEEDKYTKMYMNKFGIENVRGGSYSKINLEEYQIKAIESELRTVNHLCFRCGKFGHFASNCVIIR